MAQNSLQAVDIEFQVREAGTSDEYTELVCTVDDQIQLTNDITETNTRCGTKIGVSEAKATISGNATFNLTPDSDEASYDDVSDWQIAKTSLDFRYRNAACTDENGNAYAAGAIFDFVGTGYFVDSTLTGGDKEVAKFSFSFKPTNISKA
jgi:hypothetical protein